MEEGLGYHYMATQQSLLWYEHVLLVNKLSRLPVLLWGGAPIEYPEVPTTARVQRS